MANNCYMFDHHLMLSVLGFNMIINTSNNNRQIQTKGTILREGGGGGDYLGFNLFVAYNFCLTYMRLDSYCNFLKILDLGFIF